MSSASPLPMPSQPTSAPTGAEKKVYEPSMEEILASIRRIIADDQSLPRSGLTSDAFASPLSPLPQPVSDPVSVAEPEPEQRPAAAQTPEPPVGVTPVAHGAVAAPQFASPHPLATPVGPSHPLPPSVAAAPAPTQTRVQDAHVRPAEPEQPRIEPVMSPPEPLLEAETGYRPAVTEAETVATDDVQFDDAALYEAPIAPPTEPEPVAVHPQADAPSVTHRHAPTSGEGGASLFSAATDSSVASAFNMLAASRLADNSDELMNLAREMIRPLLRTWIDDNLPSMVERMVRAEIERVARGGR